MLRHLGLAGPFIIPLLIAPVYGAASDADRIASLGGVTVLATRTERPIDAVPRAVDVVKRSEIDLQQNNDLGSVVETLPNVTLNGSPRPSGEQIQIRGLSGDRVLTLVDGVRQSFTKGHLADAFIDPELIKQVDVERGPASVLWGSGALGGVVSVETVNVADLLVPGQSLGGRIKGGYQSATEGWLGSGTLYGTWHNRVDGLVNIARRDNGDIRLGSGETLSDSAYRVDSLLAKTTLYPTGNQLLRLSHHSTWLEGTAPSNPTALISRENPLLSREITRGTTQLNWQWAPPTDSADLNATFYHSRTAVDEAAQSLARQDKTTLNTLGFDLANTSHFELGLAGNHALTYGADGFRDRAKGRRNGDPRPEFPDARRRLLGAFAQDEVAWGAWTVGLGLRYDRYHSKSDDNVAPKQSNDHLSKQASLMWQATDWLSAYGSYAEAFRAPSLDELYPTGTHFGANQFIPNPSLKPETAANKEVGLRAHFSGLLAIDDELRLAASAFRNDVRDFIDTIVTVTTLPGPPFVGGTTRSENVTDARLLGFELNARYQTNRWFATLGYGQTRGTNRSTDQPLADISPDRWVAQVGLHQLPWNGVVRLRATLVDAQKRVPLGTDRTAGYAVFDMLTSWAPRNDLSVDFAIANLADKAYRRHNAVIDETGRNFKATLSWKF